MVGKYKKNLGNRNYKNYFEETVKQGFDVIKIGISKKREAMLFKI